MKRPSKIKQYFNPSYLNDENPEQQEAPQNAQVVTPVATPAIPDTEGQQYDENSAVKTINTTAPAVPADQAATPSNNVKTPDDYVRDLYAINPPAPKVDKEKRDRIQKMGRLNQLGRGIGVLGDILNSAVGAKVSKAATDTTSPRLMQEYLQTLDKDKASQEQYDQQVFEDKKRKSEFDIKYSQFKEAKVLEGRKADLTEKIAKSKDEQSRRDFELKLAQTQAQIDGLRDQRKETSRHNRATEDNNRNKAIKPVNIMTSSGQRHSLSPDEFSFLTNEATGNETILNDPKFSQWFDKVEITRQVPNTRFGGFDKLTTGQFTYKIKPTADKHALAQAMLELHEQGKISLPGRKDQPRNVNTPSVPVLSPPVTGASAKPSTNSNYDPSKFERKATQPNNKPFSTGGYY